ncbi:MAG: cytochrome c [Thermodesulfobacteriota bacterium]|jgi:mono/diheme cytochrome c family protein
MKRRIVCCLALAAALSTTAVYADGGALFREKCGSCHQKGAQAPPVNPADKAAVVWEKFFDRNRHTTDISGAVNADELKSVVEYLKQFAADSDRPETAAIPK